MTPALPEIPIYQPTYTLQNSTPVLTRYVNSESASGDFPVTDSCERSATVMSDDYVKLSFKLLGQVVFDAFSFIYYDDQLFFLKEQYRPTAKGSYYQYDMKFVSVANMLSKPICMRYMTVGGVAVSPEPEINMNGTLAEMAVILIDSIHGAASRLAANQANNFYAYILQGMTIANDMQQNTSLQTFSFSGAKISDVLTQVAETYEIEWWVSQESQTSVKLHLCKCETGETLIVSDRTKTTGNNLQPYESRGLLSCEYSQEWSDVPQKIIPFGSDRNITRKQALQTVNGCEMYVSYGKQLRLAPNTTYTVTDRDGNNVQITTDALGAFTNTAVQSGIETVETFDDIYPRCHFRVLGVTVKGTDNPIYTIAAAAIKADGTSLMSYAEMVEDGLLPLNIEPNETLSIIFESGYLNGREFEVAYDIKEVDGVVQWTLTIVPEEDGDNGVSLPFGNFVPRAMVEGGYEGDMFAIFHMIMPEAYVIRAQNELAQAAYEKLLAIEDTRPEVKCKAEPISFANKQLFLGRRVGVHSELFGNIVENDGEIAPTSPSLFLSRVTSFSHSLTKPNEVEFKLASARVNGTLSELATTIADRTSDIRGLEQRSINLSRRGWHDASELREMLNSLAAEMMLVGVEKNQFAFTSAILCVNGRVVSGVNHFNKLQVSAGYIQHTQEPYIKYNNGGRWVINATDLTADSNNNPLASRTSTPYYLYAICASNTSTASLVLSQSKHDNDTDYLLLGVLSAEYEDANAHTSFREFNRTNGYTQIAGGTITTEQIQDPTRSLIIDFSSNPPRIIAINGAEIVGKFRFTASSNTVQELLNAMGGRMDGMDSRMDLLALKSSLDAVQESLQSQIDGAVSTYYHTGVPFADNASSTFGTNFQNSFPANPDWGLTGKTAAEVQAILEAHVGDLYYNKTSGYVYRFMYDDDANVQSFGWLLIHDTDITAAMAAASRAQATADGKVTIFRTQPTVPYKQGDMWQVDNPGKVLYSTVNRLENDSYHAEDWVSAAKYAETIAEQAANDILLINSTIEEIQSQMDGFADAILGIGEIQTSLQNQIDSAIDTWFLSGVPTTSNAPYNTWVGNDFDVRDKHLGDLYYNKQAGDNYGKVYKFDKVNNAYSWTLIEDDEVAAALKAAANAQATADGKITIFSGSTEPQPPYKVGDMWQNSSTGKVLYSVNNRTSGSYVATDWKSSSEYAETLAMMEIGGENLIGDGSKITIDNLSGSNNYYYIPLVGNLSTIDGTSNSALNAELLEPSTKYVFSFDKAEWIAGHLSEQFSAALFWKDGNGNQHVTRHDFDLDHDFGGTPFVFGRQYAVFETPALETGATKCAFIVYAGVQGETAQRRIYIKNAMLQKGEKPTIYHPFVEHLVSALKGSTEVLGGLVMTNVLMLKDEDGNVTAGMSGQTGTQLNPEKVLMWGGGTYDEALYAASNEDYKKSQSGSPITSLLKKDGTGKIGCFEIGSDSVLIKAGENKIFITNKTIDNSGLKLQHSFSALISETKISSDNQSVRPDNPTYFTRHIFVVQASKAGKYRIVIPTITITAAYSVTSYPFSGSGGDNGYGEAYVSYSLCVRVVKIGTNEVLYQSSYVSIEDFGDSNDNGMGTNGRKRDSDTKTIQQIDTQVVLPQGNVAVEVYGTYNIYSSEEGEGYDNSNFHGASDAEAELHVTTSQNLQIYGIEKFCVVAKDGIGVIANANSRFYVQNDSNSQLKVIANGLPISEPSTTGQLWRDGSFVKIHA